MIYAGHIKDFNDNQFETKYVPKTDWNPKLETVQE